MRLKHVVADGLFCGLSTVEECITNFYLHFIPVLPNKRVKPEIEELEADIKRWEVDRSFLNWEEIHAELDEKTRVYDEWIEKQVKVNSEDEVKERLDILWS